MLPDDGPVGPKHVGVIFKINFNMRRRFLKVYKVSKRYIGANSWFYNLYMIQSFADSCLRTAMTGSLSTPVATSLLLLGTLSLVRAATQDLRKYRR